MNTNEIVGQRIRDRRLALGLSTTKVAEQLDVHRQSINRFERGSNSIGIDLLKRIADVLGVKVGELVD